MKRSLWIAILLVLGVIIYLSFVRPHQMVSPGDLIPAHSALQNDCFACHTPLRGASAERCTTCHIVADIGLRTTKGAVIPKSLTRPAFHQALTEPNCMACHSDHQRPSLTKASSVRFEHALLKTEARSNCQSCHMPPRDDLHRGQDLRCATCHQPAHWKPATFAHDRYFMLDRNHNTACTTCHLGGNYQRYTCYGCHEHQPAQIIAEHREEGIRNVENCVRCHRSADAEAGEDESRERGDD
jgi:hypothetical protein